MTEPKDKMVLNIPKTEKDLEKEKAKETTEVYNETVKTIGESVDVSELIKSIGGLSVGSSSLKDLVQISPGEIKVPAPPASSLQVNFKDVS